MWIPKTERCAFLVDNLDLPAATGVPDARWEFFQLAHLQDNSTFRCEVKSRQIAWSWLSAAEAVAEGILTDTGTIFVSINLDEAKEKIRYARHVMDALPKAMRPVLLTDNKTELEFDNGARLMSLPAIPPRGKAQMNVDLDEFAHTRDDAPIYTAALPIISKGNCRLRMASSPMGASGRFWEVFTQKLHGYPGYTRKATPWWEVQAFCTNVKEAIYMAPNMVTSERVALFGNERIQAIYANMPEEDFQQEYECNFVDEATAWITWEEIKAAQELVPDLTCYAVKCQEKNINAVSGILEQMRRAALLDRTIERTFAAGVDIGRTRNTTEIFLVGLSTLASFPLRLMITLDNTPYDEQEDVLRMVLDKLPVTKLYIDQNGIGNNLAENLARAYPGKAEGVQFTNASKVLWATDTKMLVQKRLTPIPVDRDLAYQIHSIKRMVSPSKNLIFDTERNEKHHADKFWAWALALAAARMGEGQLDAEELTASLQWW